MTVPEYAKDILVIAALVGVWVAKKLIRRRAAQNAAVNPPQQDDSVQPMSITDARDEPPRLVRRGPSPAPPNKRRNSDGTVAPTPTIAPAQPRPGAIANLCLDPQSIRHAIILTEILGKPKSLR